MAKGERRDRREEILEAATALVAEDGFAAASVRAVAARAGIGASTMRYWFPSQQALSEAVAARVVERATDDGRIDDRSVPAADRLLECLAQFLPHPDLPPAAAVAQAQAWFTLVQAALSPTASPLARGVHAATVRTAHQRVRGWLDRLAEESALAPAAEATRDLTATALLTRVDGLVLALLTPGAEVDVPVAREILRRDVEALVAGG